MRAAQIADGLRRRWHYRNVKATEGTILREYRLGEISMLVADVDGSIAVEAVAGEIGHGAYDFSDITFKPGDVIIDLGAHVGLVSIYLAKSHPDVTIHAFEPSPPVFALLQENLQRNRVKNVIAHNEAASGTRGEIHLVGHLQSNSGGSTACLGVDDPAEHVQFNVPSVPLDEILDEFRIERCPLLKIDIEGSEYEVLYASRKLASIEHIRGEFHENTFLRSQGYTMAGLQEYCEKIIGAGNVRYTPCQMQDS